MIFKVERKSGFSFMWLRIIEPEAIIAGTESVRKYIAREAETVIVTARLVNILLRIHIYFSLLSTI